MRITVLGLGEVGFATASYLVSKNFEVWGYDVKKRVVKKARKIMKASQNWDDIPASDVYIICVYTGLKRNTPDFSSIFDVCQKIIRKLRVKKYPLVSIESTIMPGISRQVFRQIFKKQVRLIHVPHRYWAGDPIKHGVNQLRVIGAINAESLNAGLKFYKELLGIPVHIVSSIEVAEMCKIAENAYRYVQIAFAEELKMICDELNLDFTEVRDACNTKWNIEILEARDGIKGHCIPKDTKYLVSLTTFNKLLKSAIAVDKKYRAIIESLKNTGYKKT